MSPLDGNREGGIAAGCNLNFVYPRGMAKPGENYGSRHAGNLPG